MQKYADNSISFGKFKDIVVLSPAHPGRWTTFYSANERSLPASSSAPWCCGETNFFSRFSPVCLGGSGDHLFFIAALCGAGRRAAMPFQLRPLLATVLRHQCTFAFEGDPVQAQALTMDVGLVAEGLRDANIFLARCGLETKPVPPRAEDGADTEDDGDDGDTPQTTAFLALETLSHAVAQNCEKAPADVRAAVTFAILQISHLKTVLLLSESTFRGPGDDDDIVCRNIVNFHQGRLGVILFAALGMSRMRAAGPEECCRHILRRHCAAHCLEVGDRTAVRRLQCGDADGALTVVQDMTTFAEALLEETEQWYGPLPTRPEFRLTVAELQVQRVRTNLAVLKARQEIGLLNKCGAALDAAKKKPALDLTALASSGGADKAEAKPDTGGDEAQARQAHASK